MPGATILFTDCRDLCGHYYDRAYSIVSDERRKKVDSLKFDTDKKLSLSASALLLYALKTGYGISPDEIILSRQKNGKPFLSLRNPSEKKIDIYFNLSHSCDYAMCAIGGIDVGCDIEKISAYKPDIALRFFNSKESQYLESIDKPERQKEEFYRIWTKKESFIKLTGDGLSCPLSSFCVPFEDGSALIERKNYFFTQINDIPGYSASVCTMQKTSFNISLIGISDIFKSL